MQEKETNPEVVFRKNSKTTILRLIGKKRLALNARTCQSQFLAPAERVVMKLDKVLKKHRKKSKQNLEKSLKEYWSCQHCGEDTSKELKSELCGPDHWDCIINAIVINNKK